LTREEEGELRALTRRADGIIRELERFIEEHE